MTIKRVSESVTDCVWVQHKYSFVAITCSLDTLHVMKTRKGRPPIAHKRKRFSITIAEEDFTLLKEIGKLSGSTAGAIIRELIEENRETFKDIRDSFQDAKDGNAERAFARLEHRLHRAVAKGAETQ